MEQDLTEFLSTSNITRKDYESTNLKWEDLIKIRDDYVQFQENLEAIAKIIVELFRGEEKVHSVRYRIKDPNHLIHKIIRKRIEDPKRLIDIHNYKNEITDLIGIRALHLFKEDWVLIDDFIKRNWDLSATPEANVRKGDNQHYTNIFEEKGCKVNANDGYRSVHYLIKSKPFKDVYTIEIQVRTIIEEAWSEIDHQVRYPNHNNNPLLQEFLAIFNKLAGGADEMGSFVIQLRDEQKKYSGKIESLEKKIKELGLESGKTKELEKAIEELKISSGRMYFTSTGLNTNWINNLHARSATSAPLTISTLTGSSGLGLIDNAYMYMPPQTSVLLPTQTLSGNKNLGLNDNKDL